MALTNADRQIFCRDAIEWMQSYEMLPGDVFTSIPDISELEFQIEKFNIRKYKEWFVNSSTLILSKTPRCAVFLQTDVRCIDQKNQVTEYMDKSAMLQQAAESLDFVLLWHKICSHVLRPEEKRCSHKPVWSHLLCFCRRNGHEYLANEWATPDVFPRGDMVWSRGIGLHSVVVGISFLKHVAGAEIVVDPFCGHGTVLAVGNAVGMRGVGCELSAKRCRRAQALDMLPALRGMGWRRRIHYGLTCELVEYVAGVTVDVTGGRDNDDTNASVTCGGDLTSDVKCPQCR